MRARPVVVPEVGSDTTTKVSFVQNDHVVEKFTEGITGNFEALKHFREQVVRVWRKWLGRRSQRARMTWDRMRQLLERNPLPRARILRPSSTA